ncbi:MAG: hypothetical protein ABMB14_40560 [Myxococcota bacterium]
MYKRPSENWKRPLYGWRSTGYPLGSPLPLGPLHVLFARAWDRCVADPPKFEEVRR